MKILIFGGDGMLGHQLLRHFDSRADTRATLRQTRARYERLGLFTPENSFDGVDVRHFASVAAVLRSFRPDAAINAVGIVKQRSESSEPVPSIEINSLFPQRLAMECRELGIRLIHFSTDCVFSGDRGNYRESDAADADDIYGRSKLLGELSGDCVTLRTSMIGPELSRNSGLLEWFLAQTGKVSGYRQAIFSGPTTMELPRVVERVLQRPAWIPGVYHVSAEPISKCALLELIKRAFGSNTVIVPDDRVTIDRSLDSTRFRQTFNYSPPAWPALVEELAEHYARART